MDDALVTYDCESSSNITRAVTYRFKVSLRIPSTGRESALCTGDLHRNPLVRLLNQRARDTVNALSSVAWSCSNTQESYHPRLSEACPFISEFIAALDQGSLYTYSLVPSNYSAFGRLSSVAILGPSNIGPLGA